MIFIELKEGFCVRKSEIIAIEDIGENRSKIYTLLGEFESNFPYSSIKSLLEMGEIEEKVSMRPIEAPKLFNQQPFQIFAG